MRRDILGLRAKEMNREKSCGCVILKDNKVLLIGAKDDDDKLF